ncbi:MAG: HAD-IIIC family phosphatase [Trebonia sp.]
MSVQAVNAAVGGAWPVRPKNGQVKCVVWDLDNTVWDGILLEGGNVRVRPEAARLIRTLDQRGILNSVASRNDQDAALAVLERAGLAEFFLCPQINWNPKSGSIAAVASALNIGLDAIAFIDDQEFERDEVRFCHPGVLCYDAADVASLADQPEFTPKFVTGESAQRRHLYASGFARDHAEQEFAGTNEEFLATLGMVMTIAPATIGDLRRAEELTIRTNQLNSTGVTYSYADLEAMLASPRHLLLVAGLEDRYGSYGKIGLALVETAGADWTLKLLLMSCRVMSRGVGTVLLHHVMRGADAAGARLLAEFVPTNRNRVMYVTYRFAGFTERAERDGLHVLAAPAGEVPEPPAYLRLA